MTLWKKFANNGISAVIREFSRITEFANNGRFCWQMDMPVFAKFTVSVCFANKYYIFIADNLQKEDKSHFLLYRPTSAEWACR